VLMRTESGPRWQAQPLLATTGGTGTSTQLAGLPTLQTGLQPRPPTSARPGGGQQPRPSRAPPQQGGGIHSALPVPSRRRPNNLGPGYRPRSSAPPQSRGGNIIAGATAHRFPRGGATARSAPYTGSVQLRGSIGNVPSVPAVHIPSGMASHVPGPSKVRPLSGGGAQSFPVGLNPEEGSGDVMCYSPSPPLVLPTPRTAEPPVIQVTIRC